MTKEAGVADNRDRDMFASFALMGILARLDGPVSGANKAHWAAEAWSWADAMTAAAAPQKSSAASSSATTTDSDASSTNADTEPPVPAPSEAGPADESTR
jgi:hypothetical protein